jgi:AcrR family transcriptional regulator
MEELVEASSVREVPTTNQIAQRAGVSVGTLYQYFDSRRAILHALRRRHAAQMRQLFLRVAGPHTDAPVRVAIPVFIDALAQAHAIAPRLHVLLVREMLADGGELMVEVQDPVRELVGEWLTRHRAEVRPPDLEVAAQLVTLTVEGAIHLQLLEDPTRLSQQGWRREVTDLVLRYLVREES